MAAASFFGSTSATFCTIVTTLVGIINQLVVLLAGVALVVFMFGMVRFIWKTSESKGHNDGKALITWGLVALFVIFSISGILNFMSVSLFGSNVSTTGSSTVCGASSGGTTNVGGQTQLLQL